MGILESLVGFGFFVVVMEGCILTCCFVAQTFLSKARIARGQDYIPGCGSGLCSTSEDILFYLVHLGGSHHRDPTCSSLGKGLSPDEESQVTTGF